MIAAAAAAAAVLAAAAAHQQKDDQDQPDTGAILISTVREEHVCHLASGIYNILCVKPRKQGMAMV